MIFNLTSFDASKLGTFRCPSSQTEKMCLEMEYERNKALHGWYKIV